MKALFFVTIFSLVLSACWMPPHHGNRAIGQPAPTAVTSAEPLWSSNASPSR